MRARTDDGFEIERRNVGEGWQAIVERLHGDLLALDPDCQVAQIKEKFGGLRYYINISEGVEDETQRKMYALTYEAEADSMSTCEVCGQPGRPSTARFWIKTVCSDHAGDQGFKR